MQKVAEHLQQRPELLPTLLTTLFEIVLFEDCPNQWSLSRPMLSLILINEQVNFYGCSALQAVSHALCDVLRRNCSSTRQ